MTAHDTATADVDLAAVTELDIALLHAWSAFDRAVSAVGVVEHTLLIAGEPVRVRFAGNALVGDLLPAIEHHPAVDEAVTPVLTIHVWDGSSTGAPIPNLSTPDPTPTRSVVAGARAVSSSPGRGVFEGIDAAAGEAWFGARAPAVLTHGERGAPFRLVFHWWGAPRARVLAHAGAVGVDGLGVLIVAPGGSGKSSTALACVEAGFVYAGDDYCFVATAPAPTAFDLYGSAKVVSDDLACYPRVAREAATRAHETDDKALLFVSRALPDQMVSSLPLHAVVVPVRSGSGSTTTEALAPSGALRALAPSTIAQLPGGAATTMRELSAIVRDLPCFTLHLGNDRESVPGVIRRLVHGLDSP